MVTVAFEKTSPLSFITFFFQWSIARESCEFERNSNFWNL